MSLVHGGPAPHFLSPLLFVALVYGPENVKVAISDVADYEIQMSLEKVCMFLGLFILHE